MIIISIINYKFIDFKNAKIHIEDRGLQFADSVYEVIAVLNKKFVDLNEISLMCMFTEFGLTLTGVS